MIDTKDKEDIERLPDMGHEEFRYCSRCGIFLMPSEIDEGETCFPCKRVVDGD